MTNIDIVPMTLREVRDKTTPFTIRYSFTDTRFGTCLIASTTQGICMVLFSDTEEEAERELRTRWPKTLLSKGSDPLHDTAREYLTGKNPSSKMRLHLLGTPFQFKVWKTLLTIPLGNTTTYGQIAKQFGARGFSQAVGGAVGDNPIAYIIPCHRVLMSNGAIGGYRWGVERKRAMLTYERSRYN